MADWQLKTPVAFIIFNRPDTTEKVFDAIRQAKPPKLLVVADGPRVDRPGEVEKCVAVRAIIDRVDWDCKVFKNYSDVNMGCKRRVSSGLDWVFDTVEESIILEDDCLPHSTFFRFCEELLKKYRNDERVMMISGTNYLLDKLEIDESYIFSSYFAIWGWASWRRAWAKYDINMSNWEILRVQAQLKSLYYQKYMRRYISSAFDAAYKNKIDTWDVQWFYTCLFNNGLCIVPKVNLISNIGLNGTHTRGDKSNNFLPVYDLEIEKLKHPSLIFANKLYDYELYKSKFKRSFFSKIRSKIHSLYTQHLKC